MPNLSFGEVIVPVAEFSASDYGRAVLEQRPELAESLARFAMMGEEGKNPEDAFNPRTERDWEYVYTGSLIEARAMGDTLVDVSTFTTGRSRWDQGYPTSDRFRAPRMDQVGATACKAGSIPALLKALPMGWQKRPPRVDLMHQSTYLNALSEVLGSSEAEELFVPDQLFALRTSNGDTLAASRLVPTGWLTLNQWLTSHGSASGNALGIEFDREKTIAQVADRVRAAIGNSALRHGLDEMLLSGDGRYYADTLIVPENISTPRDCQVGIVRISPAAQTRSYRKAMDAAADILAERDAREASLVLEPAPQA